MEKPRNGNSALVQVAISTIIEDQSVKRIHAKVNNGSIRQSKQPPFIFDPFSKPELEDIETGDVTFDKINKQFKTSVLNNSGCDLVFNCGKIIGSIRQMEEADDGFDAFSVESVEEDFGLKYCQGN